MSFFQIAEGYNKKEFSACGMEQERDADAFYMEESRKIRKNIESLQSHISEIRKLNRAFRSSPRKQIQQEIHNRMESAKQIALETHMLLRHFSEIFEGSFAERNQRRLMQVSLSHSFRLALKALEDSVPKEKTEKKDEIIKAQSNEIPKTRETKLLKGQYENSLIKSSEISSCNNATSEEDETRSVNLESLSSSNTYEPESLRTDYNSSRSYSPFSSASATNSNFQNNGLSYKSKFITPAFNPSEFVSGNLEEFTKINKIDRNTSKFSAISRSILPIDCIKESRKYLSGSSTRISEQEFRTSYSSSNNTKHNSQKPFFEITSSSVQVPPASTHAIDENVTLSTPINAMDLEMELVKESQTGIFQIRKDIQSIYDLYKNLACYVNSQNTDLDNIERQMQVAEHYSQLTGHQVNISNLRQRKKTRNL